MFIFKMPSMCAAVNCKGGYRSEAEKCQVFSFPCRDTSPERRRKWLSAMKRGADFDPGMQHVYYSIYRIFLTELYFSGKSTRLCERHFTNDMFVVQSMDPNYYRQQRTLKRRRLRLRRLSQLSDLHDKVSSANSQYHFFSCFLI